MEEREDTKWLQKLSIVFLVVYFIFMYMKFLFF